MRQAGRCLPEYRAIRQHATLEQIVGDAALCAEVTQQPVRKLGVDAAILFADITTPLPGIGVDVRLVDGVGPVIDAPIRTAADLARLRPLDAPATVRPAAARRSASSRRELDGAAHRVRRRAIHAGRVPGGGARGPRGDRGQAAACVMTPQTFHDLLAALADMTVTYLRAQVDAGVQALQLFDSWVGTLSPWDYERSRRAPHAAYLRGPGGRRRAHHPFRVRQCRVAGSAGRDRRRRDGRRLAHQPR